MQANNLQNEEKVVEYSSPPFKIAGHVEEETSLELSSRQKKLSADKEEALVVLRRKQNTEAARRSRARKADKVKELEDRVKQLEGKQGGPEA